MKLIRLIASPVLMYILAGLYALILAVATFVENSYGPAIAREYFYYAPWFILLQLLQAVNLSAMFLQGSYFKRISKGSLIFHGAFLFIWLGALFFISPNSLRNRPKRDFLLNSVNTKPTNNRKYPVYVSCIPGRS
jgi:hypothetical protein